jgi:hypothetical protein
MRPAVTRAGRCEPHRAESSAAKEPFIIFVTSWFKFVAWNACESAIICV